jgi:hypothetical protein
MDKPQLPKIEGAIPCVVSGSELTQAAIRDVQLSISTRSVTSKARRRILLSKSVIRICSASNRHRPPDREYGASKSYARNFPRASGDAGVRIELAPGDDAFPVEHLVVKCGGKVFLGQVEGA